MHGNAVGMQQGEVELGRLDSLDQSDTFLLWYHQSTTTS